MAPKRRMSADEDVVIVGDRNVDEGVDSRPPEDDACGLGSPLAQQQQQQLAAMISMEMLGV